MFMICQLSPGLSNLNRCPAALHPLISDEVIPGVFGDHLSYLIAELLPFADEIAGSRDCHRLGAFLFENLEYGSGLRLFLPGLDGDLSLKRFGYAVELPGDG